MVNVPLAEHVALRVNGLWNKSDGWMQDAATGRNLMPEDNWAGRAALKWDVSDDTSMMVAWNHDSLDQLARPAIGIVTIPAGQTYPTFPTDPTTYLNPLHAKVYNDVVGNEESRTLDDVNLFVDHSFGWADLRSTTAWRQFDTVNREDEDGTNNIALYFDTANVEDNESWYQEFKLSGQTVRSTGCPASATTRKTRSRRATRTPPRTASIRSSAILGSSRRPMARCTASPATCWRPTGSRSRCSGCLGAKS